MISNSMLSFGLLNDSTSNVVEMKDNEKNEFKLLDLNEIINVDFPEDQYYKKQTKKKQIVLHHTVSGQGVEGDISWWRSTAAHVATAVIIGWDGKIYQCFSSKYWGHHLGVHSSNNVKLNKGSIGVEIDSWGGLIRFNRQWYPAKWDKDLVRYVANTKVSPIQNVEIYPEGYRGFYGFEKYTDKQIYAVKQLLIFWGEKYNIPLKYNEEMWDLSEKALRGDSGIWSHSSFRRDKSDCHPDKGLIKMLRGLKG